MECVLQYDAKRKLWQAKMFPMLHSDQKAHKNDNILMPCFFSKSVFSNDIYLYLLWSLKMSIFCCFEKYGYFFVGVGW